MNIQEALQKAYVVLVDFDTAKLDAELLLAYVLKKSRSFLLAYPEHHLNLEEETYYFVLLKKRAQKIPIAYLVGEKEFYSLPFKVTPDVLVPRPETELLIEKIMHDYEDQENMALLDLATGSGAIAVTLSLLKPSWQVHASDVSGKALEVARYNAHQHQAHVCFWQSDWFSHLPEPIFFDVIVTNPPYLAADDPHLFASEIHHEPKLALVAEHEGLFAYEMIAANAARFLKKYGRVYCEHGALQAAVIVSIFQAQGFMHLATYQDLAQLDRVSVFTLY